MNSIGHLVISFIKSILRIGSCILCLTTGNIVYLACGFLVAEILGVIEELVDKRQ